ncbi:alginate O-acetyltransferase complex protein AlgI [Verrucomicrobium sp. GAS474]|uniref:MBOAT family protein n=1 Tax=Verrucomicrobium sp. GAS474 TaxID=1882831 RepID=UPI00087DC5ED|nr:MBOAT family protein [Verrucomicrobium sp. GAS474]SDT91528.1 alginate O-acetyltransferase complex protein AlgI [Verrucomicrobium sp. GAS474]
MIFLSALAAAWFLLVAALYLLPGTALRRAAGWFFPLAGWAAGIGCGAALAPWQRLIVASAAMLYLLKGSVLFRYPRDRIAAFPKTGLFVYLTLWPGIDAAPFERRVAAELPEGESARFFQGYRTMLGGLVLALLLALLEPALPPAVVAWAGLLAILLAVHRGYAEILAYLMRAAGWPVAPLFDHPFRSASLHDFWSRRWNLAFVQLGRILLFPTLRRKLGAAGSIAAIFVLSGLLHESALSYPAGGGWGGPFCYFVLQGILVLAERGALRIEARWPAPARRVWTWFWLLAPAPLLFHGPFMEALILPLYHHLHLALAARPVGWYLNLALWLATVGHLFAIAAGVQLPWRLQWKRDFAKLEPFNRKIFVTYYGTIGLTIVSFFLLTAVLHAEMLAGGKSALALTGFIAVFWTMRLTVDFFYFDHRDWPKGPQFVIGHTLLTSLFIAMAGTFWALVLRHLV